MKCDLCNNPAVVHEVRIQQGEKREVHLCEEHALEAGIEMPQQPQMNQLFTQFVFSSKNQRSSGPRLECPECGLAFKSVRKHGILGCAECYTAFEERLGPMIERAQNGGHAHGGKTPRRGGACVDRQRQIRRLVKELEDAVAAEQYERAAEIRDRLRGLEVDVAGKTE